VAARSCHDPSVTDPRWERYAAGAGLASAALLALGAFVAPLYPWYDDLPLRIATYYGTNASAIRVQILLTGLAGALFLWWLGSLRVHLRRAEGEMGRLSALAFGAGIAAAGAAGVGPVVALVSTDVDGPGTSAFHAILERGGLGPEAVILLHDIRLASYVVAWFAIAPMLTAVAVVAARTGAFPRWHMNATYALAVLALGSGLSVLIDTGVFAPGGPFTFVLFALFVIWLGATSWLMMRALEPARQARPRQEPGPEPEPRPDDTQPIV
jgi:hypothetical protein